MDTKDRGWPISAPFQIKNNKVYIDARKGLSPYGFFNDAQRKKGVFKQIELLLKHYNLQENDIYPCWTTHEWAVFKVNQSRGEGQKAK